MIREIAREVWNVLLPVQCAGCGQPDTLWCDGCARTAIRIHQPTLAWRHALWQIPIWAATDYTGVWQRAVVAWKERGVHGISKVLSPPLRLALQRLPLTTNTLLVPVPSSWSGWLRRGVEPAHVLAQHMAAENASKAGWPLPVVPGLRRAILPGSPAGWALSWRRKQRTRHQRIENPPRFRAQARLRGKSVVIVDDVLTTGATLEQAASALGRVGAVVVGAVVFSARSR